MRSGSPNGVVENARILLVDDDAAALGFMKRLLGRAGYGTVRCVTDSTQVVAATAEFSPDLILLDLRMPPPDGLTLLRLLRPWLVAPSMMPVIVLTGGVEPAVRRRALELGARDFVEKPLDPSELLLRIHHVLETRQLQLQIQSHNENLEEAVASRSWDVEEAQLELVERLARVAECRDDDTKEHSKRVGRCAAEIAERLGLDATMVARIRRAAPLHDVGKIGITDEVFLKPGPLNQAETATMRQHVTVGVNILADSHSAVLRCAEEIVRSHHERWDGQGYPAGLRGEEIPLAGRIVAVADVFDALSHARPYKPAWPLDDAVAEIEAGAGHRFDPAVVNVFMQMDHPYLLAPAGDVVPSAWEALETGRFNV
jgi:putative two-component system response regulator